MSRHEFSKATKREALRRSGGFCEANDPVYGLAPFNRCSASLAKGVEFDHWPFPAGDKDSDGLDNCMAVCPTCHRFKTSHYDIPVLAKGKRVSDKYLGIKRDGPKIISAPFRRLPSNTRDIWADTPPEALPDRLKENSVE